MTDFHRAALAWVLGAAVLAALWAALSSQPVGWMCLDLYPTWIAAELVSQGVPEAVYNPEVWTGGGYHPAWIEALSAAGLPVAGGTSFHYNPTYLWLTWPISRMLTLPQLAGLTFALNAMAVSYLGVALGRPLGWTRPWLRGVPTLLLGLSFPMLYAVELGQNVAMTLALGWAGARALESEERPWLGLGLWVLACLFKPWFVLAFGLLLLARRWKEFGVGIGVLAGVAWGLPRLLSPVLFSGYNAVNGALLTTTVVPQNNLSLRSHILRFSDPDWVASVTNWLPVRIAPESLQVELYLLLAAGLGVLIWGAVRPRAWLDLVRVGLIMMLLPLGIVWTHYAIFSFPLLAALALDRRMPLRALGLLGSGYFVAMWPHAIQDPIHQYRWTQVEAFALADPALGAMRAALPFAVMLLALGVFMATRAKEPTE